jgi:hypothetical protein
VAAWLAVFLRSRGTGGTLVPVRDGRTGGPVTGPAAAAPEPPPAARESTPAVREPGPDLPAAGTAGDPPPEAG